MYKLFVYIMSLSLLILTGCGNGDSDLLGNKVVPPEQPKIVDGSGIVSINGNSADGQQFPVGVPVQLAFSVDFNDGSKFSTEDGNDDADFMAWSIAGSTGATISTEGDLNTDNVTPGTVLTITATTNAPNNEADSIQVVVTDASIVDGSGIVSINGNSADGQQFPVGVPVQLAFSVDFNDGSKFSTEDGNDDADFMAWSIAGSTGATISTEGDLNTDNVTPGTVLTITATTNAPNNESDSIQVVVTDASIVDGSGIVSINGNSADGQQFPVGVPVQLAFSVDFNDGSKFSTEDGNDDADFMAWSIAGSTGATISTEGDLNTDNVTPGTVLTITATTNAPNNEADSIQVVVTDAVIVNGFISIDGNSADGQQFPIGIPVQLDATADFSDGSRYSTIENNNDIEFLTWTIEGSTGATISSEGELSTHGVTPGTTLVITATGKEPYQNTSDSISVIVTDASIVEGTGVVTIDGNSADGQEFPVGVPVQLEVFAEFSDGSSYTTEGRADDDNFITWTIAGSTGATISSEGGLNTLGVAPGTTLVITATGKEPYQNTSDSISVIVTDASIVEGTGVVTIDGNSADGQEFPVGVPVQLEVFAEFSDGSSYTTEGRADDDNFITWTIAGSTGATISSEGVLNTLGVAPGTTLVITATGKEPYTSASDSIEVLVTDAILNTITLMPNPVSVAVGQTIQISAIGHYSNGLEADLTDEVRWNVADNVFATVDLLGILTGVKEGATTVSASLEKVSSNTVTVTVTAAVTSLIIEGSNIELYKLESKPLVVTATFSNGESKVVTDLVQWLITDTNPNTGGFVPTITYEADDFIEVDPSSSKVFGRLITKPPTEKGTDRVNELPIPAIKAVYQGITSNEIIVTVLPQETLDVCGHTDGSPYDTSINGGINNETVYSTDNCLKVLEIIDENDSNTRKWFSSSPSIYAVNGLGYTQDDSLSNSGDTFAEINSVLRASNSSAIEAGDSVFMYPEFSNTGDGVTNPGEGNDAIAGVGSQGYRWCEKLSAIQFAGQSDWHLPSSEEFDSVNSYVASTGKTFDDFLWLNGQFDDYLTTDISLTNYIVRKFGNSTEGAASVGLKSYVTCVATP